MELVDILVSLSVIFTALAVYYHLKIFDFWKKRGVPGPRPWPIFGTNIYYLFENKVVLETKWKERFGRTYGLFEGYSPLLRTTDADIIKQVYVKDFKKCTDRNNQFIYQDNPRRWLLWSPGERWANQRALVSPMFTATRMRPLVNLMSESVDRFTQQVDKRKNSKHENPQSSGSSFGKFDLSCLTLDVIASSFFGFKFDTYKIKSQQDEFVKAAFRFADFHLPRFIWWNLIPRQLAKLVKFDLFGLETFQFFDTLSQKIINERRRNAKLRRDDVIQALIDATLTDEKETVFSELDDKEAHYNGALGSKELENIQKEQAKEAKQFKSFSDADIVGQMTFFFLAGFETTASTLAFSLYELANQPKIQEIVLAELRGQFGERGEKFDAEDRKGNYEKLLNLEYLDAFVSEVLRAHSVLLEHNRRVTAESGIILDINGQQVKIPKGVPIHTNGYVLQRDPEYFEQPNEIRIDRFLPENRDKIRTGTYMPFGLGPRYCVGMRFALLEVKCALTMLLLKYQIQSDATVEYPPTFKQNAVFLQYRNINFKLVPRQN